MVSPLLAQLVQRVRSGQRLTDAAGISKPKVRALATPDQIAAAESRLGFPLPRLLRDVYTTVGNGGFGPGYGLIGIDGGAPDDRGHLVVELYELYRQVDPSDPLWRWPDRLLPICHWGCAIYSCLDCSRPDARVFTFDPNLHDDGPWDQSFVLHFGSFAEYLQLWLAGENLWQRMYPGGAD